MPSHHLPLALPVLLLTALLALPSPTQALDLSFDSHAATAVGLAADTPVADIECWCLWAAPSIARRSQARTKTQPAEP